MAAVLAATLPYVPTSMFWFCTQHVSRAHPLHSAYVDMFAYVASRPAMFVTFFAAGGVYPAAPGSHLSQPSSTRLECNCSLRQGIINIALTANRVIEASVYQASFDPGRITEMRVKPEVQCNNILFAMPMPYAIGKAPCKYSTFWGICLLDDFLRRWIRGALEPPSA